MTQPAEMPSAVPTIPAPSPIGPSAPANVVAPTIEQLAAWPRQFYLNAIKAKLDEEYEDVAEGLAKLPETVRFDLDPENGNIWRVGSPLPGDTNLSLGFLFEGANIGDVVAYVFPIPAVDPKAKLWLRYTLSRVGAVTMVEAMPRETFIEEVAQEQGGLLDPETCPRCGKDVNAPDGGEDDTEPEPE
jgi:hypothetical protein